MLAKEIRARILPHLRARLSKESYDKIPWMFQECYATYHDGFRMITVRPPFTTELGGFQFYEITGSFYTMVNFDEIKKEGERL